MGTRILAAVIGLAVLLPALLWGGMPGTLAIGSLALIIGQDEYASMAMPDRKNLARLLLIPGGLAVFLAAVLAPVPSLLPTLCLGLMTVMVVPMLLTEDVSKATEQAVRLGFGLLYAPVLLAPLVWIRREEDGQIGRAHV